MMIGLMKIIKKIFLSKNQQKKKRKSESLKLITNLKILKITLKLTFANWLFVQNSNFFKRSKNVYLKNEETIKKKS